MALHQNPVPGMMILPPTDIPKEGEVLLGYKVVSPPTGYFTTRPDPARINTRGWVGIVTGLLLFWPVACVPCFLTCSYSAYQQPVYGTTA